MSECAILPHIGPTDTVAVSVGRSLATYVGIGVYCRVRYRAAKVRRVGRAGAEIGAIMTTSDQGSGGSNQGALQRALTIRLNLQISLSAVPVVEEWMDVHLNRWLESIPTPMEMPQGHSAHFEVALSTDMTRLSWRAYGNPNGIVPKLVPYLQQSGATSADMALLNRVGDMLTPKLVGSWVSADSGGLRTGWQVCDAHPFATVAELFAEHDAKARLQNWLTESRVVNFSRFAQSVGDGPATEIEFAVPGVAIDDRVDAMERAFAQLGEASISPPVRAVLTSSATTELVVGLQIREGRVSALSAVAPGVANDVVAELCGHMGAAFSDAHLRLQRAFGGDGADRLIITQDLGDDSASLSPPQITLIMLPSGHAPASPPTEMN